MTKLKCECGFIIEEDDINLWNKVNELGEDYTIFEAFCHKCKINYATSCWGEERDFEEAKEILSDCTTLELIKDE